MNLDRSILFAVYRLSAAVTYFCLPVAKYRRCGKSASDIAGAFLCFKQAGAFLLVFLETVVEEGDEFSCQGLVGL